MVALEDECKEARRGSLFTALKPSFAEDPAAETYAAVAIRLDMSEGAVKVASHRLRQRLGELVAEEVKQTVGSHEDWQEELRYLIALVGT